MFSFKITQSTDAMIFDENRFSMLRIEKSRLLVFRLFFAFAFTRGCREMIGYSGGL